MITYHEDHEDSPPPTTPFPARVTEDDAVTPVEVVPSSPISPIPPTSTTTPTRLSSDLQILGTPASVQRWVEHAARFERAKTACQVMAGFELTELKRSMGFVQGGRRPGGQKPNDSVFATWDEYVVSSCGISADTARNWMRMAEAAKPRLRKLAGIGDLIREIIDVPLSQLPPEKCRLLEDAVHKLADGRTQLDFMFELGIAKRPQGSSARGGDLGGGRHGSGSGGQEGALAVARDDWGTVARKIQVAQVSFTLLEDAEIDALIASLDATAAAMRRWRQSPKSLRDGALLDEVAKLLEG